MCFYESTSFTVHRVGIFRCESARASLCDESRSHSLSCQTSCCKRIFLWKMRILLSRRTCVFSVTRRRLTSCAKRNITESEKCVWDTTRRCTKEPVIHTHQTIGWLFSWRATEYSVIRHIWRLVDCLQISPPKKKRSEVRGKSWASLKSFSDDRGAVVVAGATRQRWGGAEDGSFVRKVSLLSYKYRKSTRSYVTNDDVKINNDIYHFQFLSLCRTRHEDVNFVLEWLEIMNNRSTTFPLDFSIHSSHRWLMSEAVKVRNCTTDHRKKSHHLMWISFICFVLTLSIDFQQHHDDARLAARIRSKNHLLFTTKWKNRGDDSIHHIFMSFKRSFVFLLYL